ncbi:hypothetical protein M2404_000625 [Rheinheimera pacifica]|nr:hypothetical protein [Rheinheimera pacifica]
MLSPVNTFYFQASRVSANDGEEQLNDKNKNNSNHRNYAGITGL